MLIGPIQKSDLASNVEVIATDLSFLSGRIPAVNPATEVVQTVTLFVGEELPNLSPNLPVDTVYVDTVDTVDRSTLANNRHNVCFFQNWLTHQVFDSSSLGVGQRIFVGGT